MVPGILVALVTMIGTLLTAQNIAREKEMGTLEQLNVTPITQGRVHHGQAPSLLGARAGRPGARPARRPISCSACRFAAVSCCCLARRALYLIVALAIGLWISTVVETQQQAMFLSFFVLMIYLLMSGLLTPIDSMPHWVQVASLAQPRASLRVHLRAPFS